MKILKYKHPILYRSLFKFARFCRNIERNIYEILILCNICGKDCGFNSSVSRFGFLCEECFKKCCEEEM